MKLPDRDWIAAHIPHQGGMCLLEAVRQWSADEIVCSAVSHTRQDNPLRGPDGLGITAGVEYAAQAMAVHGALLAAADEPPSIGMLTSVRDLRWQVPRLDDQAAALTVRAERLSGVGSTISYAFSVDAGEQPLISGRATVMLRAELP